jgi:hypothetical protein
MTLPPSYEDIIELALPDGSLLPSEDTDVYTSKLGGRPVWLNHPSKDLLESLKCPLCGTDRYLLLQMDCPREEYPAVDRIAYVFVCNTRTCSQDARGWKVIFMMKHKDQEEESKTAVDSKGKASFWDSLMNDQVEDNKNPLSGGTAVTKSEAKSPVSVPLSNPKNKFPGIYLHIDEEIIVEKREKKSFAAASISENITIAPEAAGGDEEWSGEQYEKFRAPGTDKSFNHFQKRVAHYPRQCVRYAVSGAQKPLLYHDLDINSTVARLGSCEQCNHSTHRFELQLMPAVLAFLPTESAEYTKHIPESKKSNNPIISDGMEWGSVLVYSCGALCGLTRKDAEVAEGKVIIQLELQ